MGEYRIKLINKSNFYVTNMVVQARLISTSVSNGGNIISSKEIDIKQSNILLNHIQMIKKMLRMHLELVYQKARRILERR